jgi:hypothetical protein
MQIKTTRHHFTPISWLIIKKPKVSARM